MLLGTPQPLLPLLSVLQKWSWYEYEYLNFQYNLLLLPLKDLNISLILPAFFFIVKTLKTKCINCVHFSIQSPPPQLHILPPAQLNVKTLQKISFIVTFFKLVNCGHQEQFTADSGYGDIHLSNNHQSKSNTLGENHAWWNTTTLIFLEGGDHMALYYIVNTYSVRKNFLLLVRKQ